MKIEPGHCLEGKKPGRGLYVTINKIGNQWRCLVLMEDLLSFEEKAGTITIINEDWFIWDCWRIA